MQENATQTLLREKLQNQLRSDQILTSNEDLITYAFDGTAGLRQKPEAVVFPETTPEVQAIVKCCRELGISITTRGSGTGLSGGAIAKKGGIVLNLVRMNKILEVDTANLTLLSEAGVLTAAIESSASDEGLFYPPDPSSMKISTIGGNVANNSGGLRGLKYGVTRNYVMGLEVVLPDGEIAWLGNKCVKDVAGYSLKDLFIGSEGTLGIITKVLLRLVPKPEHKKTLLAVYETIEGASDTVSEIIAQKIIPCTLEFLDQLTIQSVEAHANIGLPTNAKAVLLMETDGHQSIVDMESSKMESIASDNGAIEIRVAKDDEEAVNIATARRAAFSALARIQPTTILEDATVPRSELTKMVSFVQSISEKYDVKIANFGHMGDGNLHPTFLTNERDTEEMERVEKAMAEIFDYTIKLKGTITGEHGVGLAKKPFLPNQFDDASYALLKTIKNSIDPQNIMNPGKIFDVSDE